MKELIAARSMWEANACSMEEACTNQNGRKNRRTEFYNGMMALVIALVIGAMFTSYCINKITSYLHPIYNFVLQCTLPVVSEYMPSYTADKMESEDCISLGTTIGDAVGAEYKIISYTEKSTFFVDPNSENGVHLLVLYNATGNFRYDTTKPLWADWLDADRTSIEKALLPFQITVPDAAQFTAEGNGWHRFTVDCCVDGTTMIDGSIRCRYAEDGTIKELENTLTHYSIGNSVNLLSAEEAYDELCTGNGLNDVGISKTGKYYVTACQLTYAAVEEGVCLPVYSFTVSDGNGHEGIEIYVPAVLADDCP